MSLVEPLVRRPERAVRHARERLIAGDAPGRQLEHRLEDGHDRALLRQQRLDLRALAVAGQLARQAAVVAPALVAPGALRPVQRAVGQLEQAAGVALVVRVRRHAGRAGELPASDLYLGDRGACPLGCLGCVGAVDAREDERELLPAEARDDVVLAHGGAQLPGDGDQHLVALGMAVGVVDGLEVVEVDDHDAERALERGRAGDLVPQPLVAGAMVQQTREPVAARLLAQRVALSRGLERERRHRREALDLGDLGRGELLVDADPVDVQRGHHAVTHDERDRHERLRLHLGPLDDRDDRVLVGALDVARAAVRHHPAGHALIDAARVGHHLLGVRAKCEDRHEHLRGAIDLVDGQLVVVEQLAQVVRDAAERVGERVRGENAGGGVDERLQRRGVGVTRSGRRGHLQSYRPSRRRS